MSKRSQKGFTLLETTASIVLLGTVAASALPRLVDLQDQAESAVVGYANSSLDVATRIASLKQKLERKSENASIMIADQQIQMENGMPLRTEAPKLIETKGLAFNEQTHTFVLLTTR